MFQGSNLPYRIKGSFMNKRATQCLGHVAYSTLNTKSFNRHMPSVLLPEVFCLLGNSFLAQTHSESCSSHQAERIPPLAYRAFQQRRMSRSKERWARWQKPPKSRGRRGGKEKWALRKEGKLHHWVLRSEGITCLMKMAMRPDSMVILAKGISRGQR